MRCGSAVLCLRSAQGLSPAFLPPQGLRLGWLHLYRLRGLFISSWACCVLFGCGGQLGVRADDCTFLNLSSPPRKGPGRDTNASPVTEHTVLPLALLTLCACLYLAALLCLIAGPFFVPCPSPFVCCWRLVLLLLYPWSFLPTLQTLDCAHVSPRASLLVLGCIADCPTLAQHLTIPRLPPSLHPPSPPTPFSLVLAGRVGLLHI